jgi:hypothetical protein
VLEDVFHQRLLRFNRVVRKTRFWQRPSQTVLSERETKALNRLLDGQGEEFVDGIIASKYGSLAKVSKATATRELTDLLKKGCLLKLPGGGPRSLRGRTWRPCGFPTPARSGVHFRHVAPTMLLKRPPNRTRIGKPSATTSSTAQAPSTRCVIDHEDVE